MGRKKGFIQGSSPNPKYALTPEKYSAMLKVYVENPHATVKAIYEAAGVGRPMATRALNLGWPELNLPALVEAPAAFTDPEVVKAHMTTMQEKEKAIVASVFATEIDPVTAVLDEENEIKKEKQGAARLASSITVKAAKNLEKLIDHYQELIEAGAIDLPDTLRPEHLFALIKASDIAAKAIHTALSTEKLVTGKEATVAGAQITNLLIGATPEELRQVALTGHLPPRLLGIDVIEKSSLPDPIDVLEVAKAYKNDPTLADKKNSVDGGT